MALTAALCVAAPALAGDVAAEGAKAIDWFKLSMGLVGGLALFLFGMEQMSESLKLVAGDRMKTILRTLSGNRVAGVATGAAATAVVQSSSVTTVMVVGFITAGLMTLPQALGIILGANIGTTITAQIIAFKVTKYALLMVAAGFGIFFMARKQKVKQWGMLLLGLGLIFYGMSVMSDAMRPLRDFQPFLNMMENLSSPFLGILVGAVFTALIQSSSATTVIVVSMAISGLVSLDAGLALTLGANIGTCVTAALAAIGKPREAIQAAAAHTIFNSIGVIAIAPFIPAFAEMISGLAEGDIPRQIAHGHTIFNVAMTLLFLPFLGPFAKLLERLIPIKKKSDDGNVIRFLDPSLVETPFAAMGSALDEFGHMSERVESMLDRLMPTIFKGDAPAVEELKEEERAVAAIHKGIAAYLSRITVERLAEDTASDLIALMTAATGLKNIAHTINETIALTSTADRALLVDDVEAVDALSEFHQEILGAFREATAAYVSGKKAELPSKADVVAMRRKLEMRNMTQMSATDNKTDMVAYAHQIEIASNLGLIFDHVAQIVARKPNGDYQKDA